MEFEQIISSLSPDMQAILRQLAAGGGALTARELLGIIARLAAAATATQRATIWRALMWLANAGRIQLSVLIEASELLAAGEGAVVAEGAATAAGAGTAVAVATVVAFLAALIFAMMSIAFAYYMVSAELETVAEIAPQGIPCTASGPTDVVWTVWRRRIGSRTSRNAAVKAAVDHARSVVTCSGACGEDPDGPQCTPVAIPISVVPKWRFLWTTTTVTYRVGCACL